MNWKGSSKRMSSSAFENLQRRLKRFPRKISILRPWNMINMKSNSGGHGTESLPFTISYVVLSQQVQLKTMAKLLFDFIILIRRKNCAHELHNSRLEELCNIFYADSLIVHGAPESQRKPSDIASNWYFNAFLWVFNKRTKYIRSTTLDDPRTW
jgi:hypothetical protein